MSYTSQEQPLNISLEKLIEDFELEIFYSPENPPPVRNNDINRPGLQFVGHYAYYDNTRIQIVGKAELAYLDSCSDEEKSAAFEKLLITKPPVILFTRGITPCSEFIEIAKKHEIPLLGATDDTSVVISKIIAYLNLQLAPRITRHGGFVEIYGEGMLILGDSGVGKSETVLELIKRGHRLIADDAVEIRKTSNITVVGSAPDNIRHFMELRGIGIINTRHLFGIGAVKLNEKIDMAVELQQWDPNKVYDRMGIDENLLDIIGVKVPYLVIPVRPGRNLAVILEVAAMNNRQKKMGYNAAEDLLGQLGMDTVGRQTIITKLDDF